MFLDPNWSELMTAIFDAEKEQLLTRVTLGGLVDLGGYGEIVFGNADPIPGSSLGDMQVVHNSIPRLRTRSSFVLQQGAREGLAGMHETRIHYLN